MTDFETTPAAGPGQPMTYRQGTVVSWNEFTLENEVNVGGTVLRNLPVLGVGDAAAIEAGSTVGLMVAGRTMAIIGRLVIPGTAAAESAITMLSRQVYSTSIDASGATSSATFGDLDDAVGPVVDVDIRAGGRALVMLSALITYEGDLGGFMSFEMAGANTGSATDLNALAGTALNADIVTIYDHGATRVVLLTGLTPGRTTFVAKYRAVSGGEVWFDFRNVTVFAL